MYVSGQLLDSLLSIMYFERIYSSCRKSVGNICLYSSFASYKRFNTSLNPQHFN